MRLAQSTSLAEDIVESGGCVISEGTLRSQDLLPLFLEALCKLNWAAYQQVAMPAVGFSVIPSYALEDEYSEWWNSETCSNVMEMMFESLNEFAPEGYHFSSQEGDGACFGFWKDTDE